MHCARASAAGDDRCRALTDQDAEQSQLEWRLIMPENQERLHAIAGRWATDGHVVGEPSVLIKGFDGYEVLPGGYFLVHHVDVTVGNRPVQAIEIIGEPDPASGGFLARSFDNSGSCEVMTVTVDEAGVFRFTGGPDVAAAARPVGPATARVRATLTPALDGRSMAAFWERSADGRVWEPWMHISFTRT
jgi:hypothetical protein